MRRTAPYSIIIVAFGILLAGSGCAQNGSADGKDRPSHYAQRTNRLGSNIPQPYAAGADSNSDNMQNDAAISAMQRQSLSSGSMGNGGAGGR